MRRSSVIAPGVIALGVVALAVLALGAPEALRRMSGKPWDGIDDWWPAKLWWEGNDPYSAASIKRMGIGLLGHPPSTSFYALPLAFLDVKWMGRILGGIELALLYVQLWLIGRELRVPSPKVIALAVFAAMLHTPFLLNHLAIAQTSLLIGFCLFLAWFFLRRERDLAAGLALGFACTIKAFPAGVVLLVLLCHRWRAVATACALWLCVAALMTSRFGLASWREYLKGEAEVVGSWIGHPCNVSLQGIVLRAMHPACVADAWTDPTAARIAAGIALALLVGCWLLSRRVLRRGELDLPYALFFVWSMWANTFYFEHYNVLLVLPIAIAASELWRAHGEGLSRRWSLLGAVTLAGAIACCMTPTNSARVLLFWTRTQPKFHLRAHLVELQTALPLPLIFLVLATLAYRRSRRSTSAEPAC